MYQGILLTPKLNHGITFSDIKSNTINANGQKRKKIKAMKKINLLGNYRKLTSTPQKYHFSFYHYIYIYLLAMAKTRKHP